MEKEVTEAERKLLIRKKYLEKIRYSLDSITVEQTDLSNTVKGFFSEFLKLDYQYTYEELSLELNKIYISPDLKEKIDALLRDIIEIEYMLDKGIDQSDIKELFKNLEEIVTQMLPVEASTESTKSFLEKILPPSIFKRKAQPPATEMAIPITLPEEKKQDIVLPASQEPTIETPITKTEYLVVENNSPQVVSVYEFIEEAYMNLNSAKTDTAREYYLKAIEGYNILPQEEKQEVYLTLYELYIKLKNS